VTTCQHGMTIRLMSLVLLLVTPTLLQAQDATPIAAGGSTQQSLSPRAGRDAQPSSRNPGPPRAAWPDFPVIEWQPRNPAQLETLKRIGVTAGAVIANRDGDDAPEFAQAAILNAAGMGWYLENIATDFYAPYHRYFAGKPVNWLFEAAQARYRAHPDDITALYREPGLSDPSWQRRMRDRMAATVRRHAAAHPLFYNLADEAGIADLSAYWDFDMSPASLMQMRVWLRGQYGSLAALNAQWGTNYTTWDAVQPELTREAMRRTDDNFSQWSDFKAWMDEAFAGALRLGTQAVHAADPTALAAIEGAQMPGWGGYDYTRLAHAVDVMEIYDSGENLPIVRSLNPQVIPLATTFTDTPEEMHRLWGAVLRGVRGFVLWDEDESVVHGDGSPGARAAFYAPLFAALHGPFGQAILGATPMKDPIAILYSPASFRVQWMLDHRSRGDAWLQRSAELELEDNAFRVALRGYSESLAGLGLQPRFIAPADLASTDHLAPTDLVASWIGAKVLILPDTIALSPREASAIATFVRKGGRVIASTPPGVFDAHGKRLPSPSVARTLFQLVEPSDVATLRHVLGVTPRARTEAALPVESHWYRGRAAMVLALQVAKPAAASVPVTLTLPAAVRLRDVRAGITYPRETTVKLTLDPVAPTLLEVVN
jgi:hypothetical protein